jgi:hypothetical protein
MLFYATNSVLLFKLVINGGNMAKAKLAMLMENMIKAKTGDKV